MTKSLFEVFLIKIVMAIVKSLLSKGFDVTFE